MLFKQNFRYIKDTRAKVVREVCPEVAVWTGQQKRIAHRTLALCRGGVGWLFAHTMVYSEKEWINMDEVESS